MDRIRVVGSSGSGKTTTAAAIARALAIPRLELDSVHWLAGWKERDDEEFVGMVTAFAAAPRWVIDGNYIRQLGGHLDGLVDTYVWLDLPRWRVTSSVLARSLRRSLTGEQLWDSGNRERLSFLLNRDPDENVVLWAWTQHGRQRRQWEEARQAGGPVWVRLRSRREVDRFIAGLGASSGARV